MAGNNTGGRIMVVRQLTPEERFDAALISTVAFHGKIDDLEKKREETRRETVEDWGAFSDEGKMMARIINNRYTVFLDGHEVQCGGIGAVSTLPEYREEGAIRAIFRDLLSQARKNGEILSALYPFNHAFYRKFGYETVCKQSNYTFAPEILQGYHHRGKAVMLSKEEESRECLKLYADFAQRYNLAAVRSEKMMQEHLKGSPYQERKFTYLLMNEEKPAAYLTVQDVSQSKGVTLKVQDLAWDGPRGFESILGFLSRFTADYDRIELPLPSDLELYSIIRSRKTYDIEKETQPGFMVRLVNVPEALKRMRMPGEEAVIIQVEDALIPENSGTWKVCGGRVEATEEQPDLVVSEQALAQMVIGAVSLYEASLVPDVRIMGKEELLQRVFVRKPLYCAEHF